jgi:hypothetical protein
MEKVDKQIKKLKETTLFYADKHNDIFIEDVRGLCKLVFELEEIEDEET